MLSVYTYNYFAQQFMITLHKSTITLHKSIITLHKSTKITLHKSIYNYIAPIYWQLLCTNLLTITLHKSIDNYFAQIDWQLLCINLLTITLHKFIDNYFAQIYWQLLWTNRLTITLHKSIDNYFAQIYWQLLCTTVYDYSTQQCTVIIWIFIALHHCMHFHQRTVSGNVMIPLSTRCLTLFAHHNVISRMSFIIWRSVCLIL